MKRHALPSRKPRKSTLKQRKLTGAARLSVERLEPRVMLSVADPYVDLNIATDWSEAGFTDRGYDVAVQDDGKIVVAGVRAKNIQQNSQDLLVARYNADGTIDTTFNETGFVVYDFGDFYRDIGRNISLGADGSIVVSAVAKEYFTDPEIKDDNFIARFDSDGTLLGTVSGMALVEDLLVLSSGKILYVNKFKSETTGNDFELTQLNPDLSLDTSFGSGGSVVHDALGLGLGNAGFAMAEQSDGKIVVAGQAHLIDGEPVVGYVARFLADGTLDTSYASEGEATIDPSENVNGLRHIVLDANDNAYLVEWSHGTSGDKQFNAVKFTNSGILDASFGGGGIFRHNLAPAEDESGNTTDNRIAVDQDGRVYLSGNIIHSGGQTDGVIIRTTPEGTLDTSFGYEGSIIVDVESGYDRLRGMAIDAAGRPVVTGEATTTIDGRTGLNTWLLRIDPRDGEIATSTYSSTDVPKNLKDAKGRSSSKTNSTLTVDDSFNILDLNVRLDVSHTWDEDLDVFLVSPDGIEVELFTDVGGEFDNFTGTTLDDEASASIASAAAPFTGVFQPEGQLSDFNGQNTSGIWTLRIEDDVRGDVGTLNSWSIVVTHLTSTANTAPVAVDDGYSVDQDGTLSVAADGVLANDSDANGDSLTAVLVNDATNGSLTLNADGSFSYTPTAGFNGSDSFTYTANDGSVDSSEATVTIAVNPPSEGDIYVWDITFDSRLRGKGGSKHDERIVVVVNSDANGVAEATDAGAAGADVTVEVRDTSDGALLATLSGPTGSDGTFTSVWTADLPDGIYVAEVVGLTHATLNWNGSLDPTGNDGDADGDGLPDQLHTIPHPAAASQQFAMAAPLDESTGSTDTEPQRRSRLGARDEVFSRLARSERPGRASRSPLRRLQATTIDQAMTDLASLPRVARRSRR
jgi:uncharacterized delta-60 repeat protein